MTSHAPGCCPPPSFFSPRERTRCLDRTTTSDVCSHGNGPECLDNGPCSAYVDGYPTSIRRKLKKLDEAGAYMDVDTHECFRVTSDQGLEPLYPKLPSKPLRVKGAIYELTSGTYVRWNGKKYSIMCSGCVDKLSNYPDEEKRPRRLCATCADKAGTKTVRKPCRDCPDDDKKEASHPDEEKRPCRLCARCADKAGTKTVRNPCRDCPDDDKKEAHYPDEEEKPCRLCATCADKAGTKTVLRPCRDCPDDDKKEANYPDEEETPCTLCATCADKAGTKTVRNPCRDCPDDDKKEAHHPDEEGKPCRLCARCADKAPSRRPC